MNKIKVRMEGNDKAYPIFLGESLVGKIADFIMASHKGKRIAVITDNVVERLHKKIMLEKLAQLNLFFISIPAGEGSKSRKTKEKIEDILLENKFGKDTLIIAFGGGVVGDLAGFVASTFNRGVPFVHVPTTLLAIVDSSIGGKTAVNTQNGKNLIGSFHAPDAVFADLDFLATLPDEEFLNGIAEIIKISIVKDAGLFRLLKKKYKKILQRDKEAMMEIIKRSIELKKDVIEKDNEESGLRQILNFGHTFGHALEAYCKYKIRHGYAVSQGMLVESNISVAANNLSENEEGRIRNMIKSFGFPLTINMDVNTSKILELMECDKKSRYNKPRFVLIDKIGKVKSKDNNFSFEVEKYVIEKAIEKCKDEYDKMTGMLIK